MTDLFPIPSSPSPRLQWLWTYRLHVRKDPLPRGTIGPHDSKPFACSQAGCAISGFGETELEAEQDYARIIGIKHYLSQELEAQGGHDAEQPKNPSQDGIQQIIGVRVVDE